MGAVSIQNDRCDVTGAHDDRAHRWQHVAETVGLPLTAGQVVELADLDDLTAARRFLPQLGDAELHEVLWALGA